MADVPTYFKGLSRFEYWDYLDINPLLTQQGGDQPVINPAAAAHRYLSTTSQAIHEDGDSQAIFDYAQSDVWAFRAPWVVTQVEAWRQENTPESRRKLQKLMQDYASEGRGKRRPSTLYYIIKKDQDIFKAVIRLNQLTVPKTALKPSRRGGRGCYQIVAKTHQSNHHEVETTYKRYKRKADELMGKVTTRDCRITQLQKDIGMIPHEQEPIPPPRLMSSWEDVFQWLDSMAETLAFVGGVEDVIS